MEWRRWHCHKLSLAFVSWLTHGSARPAHRTCGALRVHGHMTLRLPQVPWGETPPRPILVGGLRAQGVATTRPGVTWAEVRWRRW